MLKGERIELREMLPSDVKLLYDWENDRAHWHLSNTTRPISKSDIEDFVKNVKDIYLDEQLRLMIVSISDDRPIGTLDIFNCDFHNKRGGLGILIADREDRRRGYGFESLEMIKMYARDVLHFKQLYANILKSNGESLALFEKAGFIKCGEKREWIIRGDEFEDEWMYQVLLK